MAHSKAVGGMLPGDHAYVAYDTDAERDAIMAAYVRDGLRAGHAVIRLVDSAPGGPAAARPPAGTGGDDDGDVIVLPADIGLTGTGLADAIGAATRGGRTGVRLTAEASPSPRGWPGTEAFAAFEAALHRAATAPGSRVMALCLFDRRWFGAAHLRMLDGRHGVRVRADDLFDDGVLTITPLFAPPGLRLSGAIDESTLPALVAALRDYDLRAGPGDAHLCLDLARLDFCDLDGLRTLIEANRTSAVLDRQVILRAIPGCVELMLRASGWETAPGVVREAAL
ncbi:MEDS domain-containing protein [Actinomadura graeca]|uniref:MEDS domain-containing protein n=1 Tax=Actinomadura graeca TaxID=2750812 RepID=A0ABX8QSG4_9ACTN|nr:MEDS domain-containing protein [Actinomadura graeca]QXJ21725.1 MEDS domain-containing protein [Actinomadura graeca]